MKKFKVGKRIKSLEEFVNQEYIYQGQKLTNKGWFQSWQLRYILVGINKGWFYTAEYTDEYKSKIKEEIEKMNL